METQTKDFEQINQESKSKMIRGSIWMSVGSFASRLLGAVYIIPWYLWMGENAKLANNLFTKGYNIYALFLMISTAGIPGAIAKQISHYNSLNEYKVSKQLFKRALTLMAVFGLVCAGLMFFGAPVLAAGNKDLIPTMRALSTAVLIFPVMSAFRGFFQGNHNMMPSAVSQIVEQIARVFYMLTATFTIMKVMEKEYVTAVTHSTFAAFIGALAALGLLVWFYQKQLPEFEALEASSNDKLEVSANELFKEIVREAIPFIIIGSAITIVKIFDQFTFEPLIHAFTNYNQVQAEELFTLFSGNPDKLTMIIISIATSLAVTSLPLITESFTVKNYKGLAKQVSDNFQLFFFVMIPATFGMVLLSEPLNTLFYSYDPLGASLLRQACYVGVVLGFYILVSTTLQGLYGNKRAIHFLIVGFIVKAILQVPMVYMFEAYGPLLSSAIAFLVSGFLTAREIHRLTHFNVSFTARRTLLMMILTVIMLIGAFIVRQVLYLFLSPASKGQSLVIVLVVGVVGAAIYGYLSLKVRLADKLLGNKMLGLRKRLNIK